MLVDYSIASWKNMNILVSFTAISFLISLGVSIAFAAEGEPAGVSGDLNYARVTYVEAVRSDDGTWCFHTTVRHNDEGWNHYANEWQVLDDHDNEIGVRTLLHPHDDEQPFTRSQCNIKIPPEQRRYGSAPGAMCMGTAGLKLCWTCQLQKANSTGSSGRTNEQHQSHGEN